MISDHRWRELFGADPHVEGRSVDLDGKSFVVIGVLRPGFHFIDDADVVTLLRPNMPFIYAHRSVDAIAEPLGRKVKKGEKGMSILSNIGVKQAEGRGGEGHHKQNRAVLVGFGRPTSSANLSDPT